MTAIVKIGEVEMRPAPISAALYREMIEAGQLQDIRCELLEGVIVEMQAKNDPHMMWQSLLLRWFNRNLDDSLAVYSEPVFYASSSSAPSPDVSIAPATIRPSALTGADILLIAEVADSTLRKDLGPKAALYAAAGVAEYWVLQVDGPTLHRHRAPGPEGYAEIDRLDAGARIPLPFAPDLALRLADLAPPA